MPKKNADGAALRDAMIERGWRWLGFTDRDAYAANGSIYCTLVKGPVRLAIAGATWISERRGDVYIYQGKEREVGLMAVIVEPEARRAGLATAAVDELVRAARVVGCSLRVEASPIDRKAITGKALREWYERMGWGPDPGETGKVLTAPTARVTAEEPEDQAS